jgi:hypothetical protein
MTSNHAPSGHETYQGQFESDLRNYVLNLHVVDLNGRSDAARANANALLRKAADLIDRSAALDLRAQAAIRRI